MALSPAQIQQFKIDGYLLIEKALSSTQCHTLVELAELHVKDRIQPFELEAELHYPGAPENETAKGGETIRRLLQAYARDSQFSSIAHLATTTTAIQQILKSQSLFLNPNHHNCVMTKQPEYSSETLWHRDTRYWNFNDKYLVNAWFALGEEQRENGAMKILPGSHRWEIQNEALDQAQFLRLDHPFNQQRLETARIVTMKQGDVLLFSAHCFHAAGKNTTQSAKYSLVFTYHGEETQAIKGSRSDLAIPIKVR